MSYSTADRRPIWTNGIASIRLVFLSLHSFPVQPWFFSTSSFRKVQKSWLFPQQEVWICGFVINSIESHDITFKDTGRNGDRGHKHIAGAEVPLQTMRDQFWNEGRMTPGEGCYTKCMCWNKWGKGQRLKVPEGKKKGSKSNTKQGSHNLEKHMEPRRRRQAMTEKCEQKCLSILDYQQGGRSNINTVLYVIPIVLKE